MPHVPLLPEHKTEDSLSFPRLKLENDERARILCIEDQPLFEYVHNLRAPQLADGKVVKEKAQRRDGTVEEQVKYDFIGRPICLGDIGTIMQKGSDPVNCPVCAAAARGDAVNLPERRFAMHVMRYATKPGGFELAAPFQISTVVWAFSDTTFNKLVDYKSEWGDLRGHDLMLGPCTNKMYQKFDIAVAAQAAWLVNDQTKALTAETYQNNQAKDLSVFCGRRADRSFLMQDLDKVLERHAIAFGGHQVAPEVALGEIPDLEDLLSSPRRSAADEDLLSSQADTTVEPSADFSALLTGGEVAPASPASPAPAAQQAFDPSLLTVPTPQPEPATESAPPAAPVQDVTALLLGGDTPAQPAPAAAPAAQPEAPATTASFEDLINQLGGQTS